MAVVNGFGGAVHWACGLYCLFVSTQLTPTPGRASSTYTGTYTLRWLALPLQLSLLARALTLARGGN